MQLRAWRSASFILLFLFLTPTLMGFSPAVPNQKLTQIFDDLESARNISAFLRPLWDGDQAWYSRWKLVEGAKSVRIYGQEVPVHASVVTVNDLSAHADGAGLQQFAEHCQGLKNIFLVHAEPDRADALAVQFQQAHPEWKVNIPMGKQTFSV